MFEWRSIIGIMVLAFLLGVSYVVAQPRDHRAIRVGERVFRVPEENIRSADFWVFRAPDNQLGESEALLKLQGDIFDEALINFRSHLNAHSRGLNLYIKALTPHDLEDFGDPMSSAYNGRTLALKPGETPIVEPLGVANWVRVYNEKYPSQWAVFTQYPNIDPEQRQTLEGTWVADCTGGPARGGRPRTPEICWTTGLYKNDTLFRFAVTLGEIENYQELKDLVRSKFDDWERAAAAELKRRNPN